MKFFIFALLMIIESLQLVVFVKQSMCVTTLSCDGTIENPYPNLSSAIENLLKRDYENLEKIFIEILEKNIEEPKIQPADSTPLRA